MDGFGSVCRSTTPPGDGSMARATAMKTGRSINLTETESVGCYIMINLGNGMIILVIKLERLYVNHLNSKYSFVPQ